MFVQKSHRGALNVQSADEIALWRETLAGLTHDQKLALLVEVMAAAGSRALPAPSRESAPGQQAAGARDNP